MYDKCDNCGKPYDYTCDECRKPFCKDCLTTIFTKEKGNQMLCDKCKK